MKPLIIFLAGELKNPANVRQFLQSEDFDYYAADGGVRFAELFSVEPRRVLGDFDSAARPRGERVLAFPAEKDQTDSELALDQAISDGYTDITMIAPFGNRLDHTVANLRLAEKAEALGVRLRLYDGENLAFIIRERSCTFYKSYRYISFFPLHDEATVTLHNFKYPLERRRLFRTETLGVSNEPGGLEPLITVHNGAVLCVCIEKNEEEP